MSQPTRALIAASALATGAGTGIAFPADAIFAGSMPSTPGFAPGGEAGGGEAGGGETGGAAATTAVATTGGAGGGAAVVVGSLRTVVIVVMFAGLETAGPRVGLRVSHGNGGSRAPCLGGGF